MALSITYLHFLIISYYLFLVNLKTHTECNPKLGLHLESLLERIPKQSFEMVIFLFAKVFFCDFRRTYLSSLNFTIYIICMATNRYNILIFNISIVVNVFQNFKTTVSVLLKFYLVIE